MDLSILPLNSAGTTQQNLLVHAKVTTFLIFPDGLMKALNHWKLGQTVSNGEVEVFMVALSNFIVSKSFKLAVAGLNSR